MIFRVLASAVVLSALIVLVRLLIVDRAGTQKTLFQVFKPKLSDTSALLKIRTYVAQLSVLFFVLLAFTGFIPVIIFGAHITGIWLIVHVTVAPLFVASFTFYVILSAHNRRFTPIDYEFLKTISNGRRDAKHQLIFIQKVTFWVLVTVVIPAAMSIIMQMYPLFDTRGLEFLLNIHRYSTLFLFMASIFYILFILKHNFSRNQKSGI